MSEEDKKIKARITELVERLRGTGGLPLAPSLRKNLKSWIGTAYRRGYLELDYVKRFQNALLDHNMHMQFFSISQL